jgi:hypothetical protein
MPRCGASHTRAQLREGSAEKPPPIPLLWARSRLHLRGFRGFRDMKKNIVVYTISRYLFNISIYTYIYINKYIYIYSDSNGLRRACQLQTFGKKLMRTVPEQWQIMTNMSSSNKTWRWKIPHFIISYYKILYYIILYHIIYHIILYDIISYYIIYHIILYHIILYYIIL